MPKDLLFSSNGTNAVALLPVDVDGDSFTHICRLQSDDIFPLTYGSFEIVKVLGWNEENRLM